MLTRDLYISWIWKNVIQNTVLSSCIKTPIIPTHCQRGYVKQHPHLMTQTHNGTSQHSFDSPFRLPNGPSWSWSYGIWIYNYLCNQCLSNLIHGWVYSMQYYAIKFVSYLQQVGGFLPPPIELTARYNWNIVESGVKHHNPNPWWCVVR